MNFKVYVIHSAKPLSELKKILTECGGYIYAGIIYKSLQRKSKDSDKPITEKEETKKTIVFCSEQTVRQLELSHPSYKGMIADYNWESFPMPSEQQGETWNLHISGVPNDYTVREAETFIIDTLKCVLPVYENDKSNYVVEFTPRLRETGEIYGFGQVRFNAHIDHQLIKLCKLVLHNTPVNCKSDPKQKRMVTCVWHRATQDNMVKSFKYEKNKIKFKPKNSTSIVTQRVHPATVVKHVDVSNIETKESKISLSSIIQTSSETTNNVVSSK